MKPFDWSGHVPIDVDSETQCKPHNCHCDVEATFQFAIEDFPWQ